jgi:hypothetical protein
VSASFVTRTGSNEGKAQAVASESETRLCVKL